MTSSDPSRIRGDGGDRVEVCRAVDLPPGERTIVDVAGTSVGVFNVEGEYYAVANDCCHLGGPVVEGKVTREIVAEVGEPGERVVERFSETPTISCPWHGFEYRLETGEHLGDSSVVLPTYDVVVEGDTVYVEP